MIGSKNVMIGSFSSNKEILLPIIVSDFNVNRTKPICKMKKSKVESQWT
jgi:hypothetical protein